MVNEKMINERYIARCIEIARRGEYYVAPNPMVGAVLVDADGTILAEGWHEKYGEGHAEVNCFRAAEEKGLSPFTFQLYSSLWSRAAITAKRPLAPN